MTKKPTSTATWALHKLLSMSPAMAPNQDQEQDGIPFLSDRHFALHGEVMMVVVVVLFAAFILCLAVLPCLKRAKSPQLRLNSVDEEDSAVVAKPFNCFSLWLKKKRTDDVGAQENGAAELPLTSSSS
ncbi:hypothetical protein PRUPE_6G052800 [Prunus persica]|uniref:Uncharacterized protein n=1 Tax=Prunus persica TaxID=3760 RepID=M5WKK0_PRUPE|nr:uncharacterized protein LOC18775548 [Prunus persica]ONH99837.1 hypothetical protein PRUPE_6G052800 [Prunus persica]